MSWVVSAGYPLDQKEEEEEEGLSEVKEEKKKFILICNVSGERVAVVGGAVIVVLKEG